MARHGLNRLKGEDSGHVEMRPYSIELPDRNRRSRKLSRHLVVNIALLSQRDRRDQVGDRIGMRWGLLVDATVTSVIVHCPAAMGYTGQVGSTNWNITQLAYSPAARGIAGQTGSTNWNISQVIHCPAARGIDRADGVDQLEHIPGNSLSCR
jgi:hypothetical protein